MRRYYVFLIFLLAPILAAVMLTKSYYDDPQLSDSITKAYEYEITDLDPIDYSLTGAELRVKPLIESLTYLEETIQDYVKNFAMFEAALKSSISSSSQLRLLSDDIYEKRITKALGQPIDFYLSTKVEIKLFTLSELDYRGYIAKVKLFNPYIFKLELAQGKVGGLETTTDAAERTGAILTINGGGFDKVSKDGETVSVMNGNTVVDGNLVNPFVVPDSEHLFFVGTDKYGNLIGGRPNSEKELFALNPYQGASFLPILIQNGEKTTLPILWQNNKHPRTIIGDYSNNDLILIVIDGRQSDWSNGITLERLQDKLIELGVKNAYNLDGGGSTSMYFKGEVLNRPSDGFLRPVANHFIIAP
ncbi:MULTISPECIES: phosphodiester glycosidase family protein [unclassified Fusibacter]|uniref:phosphodiester glycosidase family protein n=1 Tax=unclassified Fusibacter TaxID=2624464 RepID=UPI0013E92F9E|nr:MULTISPECIES: phosphodiester glycosidase family protein [unclassified Fusibacter]MCK8058491.1 phosphodiester glycosidase family protein [Fusibacter sp. A2]NPE22740.1 phosphodiester glycosidase family protein [Fusibacter sp. A1]